VKNSVNFASNPDVNALFTLPPLSILNENPNWNYQMMTVIEPPSALSSPQRRSQVLLMFYLPGQSVTTERLGNLTQVDEIRPGRISRRPTRNSALSPLTFVTGGRQLSD
jgi:hypothetical protein